MVDYDSDGDEAYFLDLLYRFDDEHVIWRGFGRMRPNACNEVVQQIMA
jgi:hypothetical protein